MTGPVRRGTSRFIVLVVVGGILVMLAVAGAGERSPAPFGRPSSFLMPTAADAGVLSSTWYCAAGSAVEGGDENLEVVVANPLGQARRGAVTWFPAGAEPERTAFTVDGADVVTLAATDAVQAERVSAVVEISGGGVAVEHRISGPAGAGVGPCASAASPTWHFANGSTARDARLLLFLFNPFPDDAIVDITFATEGPPEEPRGLQGLPIPAGTTSVVDVGEHVRREAVTATSVRARSGRLVVDRVQRFDGSEGRTGSSLAVGAPGLAAAWHFSTGRYGSGIHERWHIANPGRREAIVLLELVPDDGEAPPEPVERVVPPRSQLSITSSEIELLGADVGYGATVRSINDVPVVVERELDTREPAATRGWSSMLGAPRLARRWAVPFGELPEGALELLAVANPSPDPVVISVEVLAGGTVVDLQGARDLELPPAGRVELAVQDRTDRDPAPLVVEADAPVVVERHRARLDGPGTDATLGIPLG